MSAATRAASINVGILGGTARFTVTAAGMPHSPKVIDVAVATSDNAAAVAGKARTALAADPDISGFFTVGGSSATVALTVKSKAANDATLNIASANGTCAGLTAAPTSANTTPGVAPVAQVETATIVGTITDSGNASVVVTAAGMSNSPKTVKVGIALGDTATLVGGKARTALAADSDVSAFFTVGGTGANVALTAKTAAANDGTMNIASANGTCAGLTTEATSANTTAGVAGTAQVETATIVGTIVNPGNATITVTAAGMTNSPKAVSVAVLGTDDASAVAGKCRTALGADPDVSAFFTVGGATDAIILTAKTKAANDATMNIASDNGTCTGLTAEPTSADTTAGVAPVLQVETATIVGTITDAGTATVVVTAAGMSNSPKTVKVPVTTSDTAANVASKVRVGLRADPDVSAFFTVSGTGANVVLTAKTAAANDGTLNISSDNGTCTGLTTEATSANTTAGGAGTAQVETATVVGTVSSNVYAAPTDPALISIKSCMRAAGVIDATGAYAAGKGLADVTRLCSCADLLNDILSPAATVEGINP